MLDFISQLWKKKTTLYHRKHSNFNCTETLPHITARCKFGEEDSDREELDFIASHSVEEDREREREPGEGGRERKRERTTNTQQPLTWMHLVQTCHIILAGESSRQPTTKNKSTLLSLFFILFYETATKVSAVFKTCIVRCAASWVQTLKSLI